MPERSAANVHGVSFKILAEVELADAGAQGVIFAQGSRFGGHALFVKDGRLHYVYNFLGIPPEQHFASEPLDARRAGRSASSSTKERIGEHGESHGTAQLYVDEDVVAEGPLRTQIGHFSPVRRGPLDRPRHAATPSASSTRRSSRSGRDDRARSR